MLGGAGALVMGRRRTIKIAMKAAMTLRDLVAEAAEEVKDLYAEAASEYPESER